MELTTNFNKRLSEGELGYLAGLIDGEGSLCICQYLSGKRRRYRRTIFMTISNTDQKVMAWLKKRIPEGYIRSTAAKGSRKQSYKFVIHRRKVLFNLVKALVPFLVIKREKALKIKRLFESIMPRPSNRAWGCMKALLFGSHARWYNQIVRRKKEKHLLCLPLGHYCYYEEGVVLNSHTKSVSIKRRIYFRRGTITKHLQIYGRRKT